MSGGEAAKRRFNFSAAWKGAAGELPAPPIQRATLRVMGAPTGDSGLIKLVPGAWKPLPKGKGLAYDDPSQSAGGIRSIRVKTKKKGGRVEIRGGGSGWPFPVECETRTAKVVLRLGEARFATAPEPRLRKSKTGKGGAPQFASTWEAIQKEIIEKRGCTTGGCHDSATASGGLDLSPDVAYANLVGVPSPSYGIERVRPGGKQDSFLWQKLAAGLGQVDLLGKGSPMPLGAAVTAEELEAVGRWIHDGARREGVVAGTTGLLGGCTPPVEAPTIVPPAPPAQYQGVQFQAPPWSIQPAGDPSPAGMPYGDNGEDEVCYATYFDLVRDGIIRPDQLVDCPDYWRSPSNPAGKCYVFDTNELTQEPNSHHSIIHFYRGQFEPNHPGFDFRCFAEGSEIGGATCDPRVVGSCAAGQTCRGAVKSSLACLTFGPPDFTSVAAVQGAGSANSPMVGGSQQPFQRNAFPDGVFGVYPAQGVIVWNSHAFNIWDEPVQNRQYWNVNFVDASNPEETKYPIRGIFDATDIFVQNVPPFQEREYCRTITFGKGTRLFALSSHNHRFGKLFRIFPPPVAASCRSTFENPGACVKENVDPVLVTTEYNDPAQVTVPPTAPYYALDSDDPAQRRLKFCANYDNGKTNPSEVKRNSSSPLPPSFGALAPGGPCRYTGLDGKIVDEGIACLNAGPKQGQACGGDDRACDSSPGAGDGICDACPVKGGVTTEDEMFIMLGSYFCDPAVPGESCTGVCASGAREGEACHDSDAECPGPAGSCAASGRCESGTRRGQTCTSDADCWRTCLPYTN